MTEQKFLDDLIKDFHLEDKEVVKFLIYSVMVPNIPNKSAGLLILMVF